MKGCATVISHHAQRECGGSCPGAARNRLRRVGTGRQNQPAMTNWIARGLIFAVVTSAAAIAANAQTSASDAHVAAAKAAAGADFAGVFQRICTEATA